MAITVDEIGEPASVTLTLSPGSEPFPTSVTFEALDGNGDVGTGEAQVAAGDHGHAGVYEPADPDIAKLDTAQTWTATQSFTTVQGAVATRAATATETIPLDGRMHILTLADGQVTVITGSATIAGQYATLVLIGSPAGTGSITWAAGHVAMNGQVLNPAAGAYTDFALDSPDGTTIRYRGVGVEP